MSLLRLALFFSFSRQGHSFGAVFSSFLLGIRYDLRYVGILELLILLTGLVPFLDPFRHKIGRKWALGLLGLAAFLVLFFYSVDFAHYSYLSQRLNASVLNYLTDAGISASMVWQTYPVMRMLLLLIVGVWLVRKGLKALFGSIQRSGTGPVTRKGRIGWWVVAFLLLGLGVFGRVGQYPLRWSDAFTLGSDYQAALALNPFQSFFSSLKFRHSVYSEARVREAIPALGGYFGWDNSVKGDSASLPGGLCLRKVVPRPGSLTSRPNVVVVICESFSAYKSSMWGNPLNTTPFFNSICGQGIFFDHCFTPSYGTARGVWAVITGIPDVAAATTTSSRNPSAVDQHTIINDFKDYEKFYFLGGSTSWANIRGLLTNNIQGLHLYEQQNYSAPKVDVWGISDKNLFLEANKVLRQQERPFFAIIQTADNHRPYTIPEEDRAAFRLRKVADDSLHRYGFENNDEMNAFRYTDFGYETFIQAASKEKYFDNTVFLFVGDHGIPGDAGKQFPRAWTDQRLTSEHVPMLIYAPKLVRAERLHGICSQVDVLPTLAGLCGISYDNTTLGRDLLDTAHFSGKEMAFIYDPDDADIGVVKGDFFYRRGLKTGKEELVPVVDSVGAVQKEPVLKEMKELSEGMYELSRYMLLQNKKKDGL
ncbi:MAG: sulfatase-like hydrolase/transferase [Bacteroidetes bacterium]|nr:sulfatase-like hydrolase/transferase [Bacteroidota bacterium]